MSHAGHLGELGRIVEDAAHDALRLFRPGFVDKIACRSRVFVS